MVNICKLFIQAQILLEKLWMDKPSYFFKFFILIFYGMPHFDIVPFWYKNQRTFTWIHLESNIISGWLFYRKDFIFIRSKQ